MRTRQVCAPYARTYPKDFGADLGSSRRYRAYTKGSQIVRIERWPSRVVTIRLRTAASTTRSAKMFGVNDETCPCGSGESYDACCGRLHRGTVQAATAEQLMRSRYSAYAVHDVDYLLRSWHPRTRPPRLVLDPLTWTGLEIVGRSGGGLFDSTGTVAFRAHYVNDGRREVLDENSRFERIDGKWTYVAAVL